LIVGYVEETKKVDEALVEVSVADLNWETEKPQPAATHDTGNGLILRMGSRIEAIEKKLDVLVQLLARAGFVRPELADTVGERRWIEELRQGSGDASNSQTRKVS
jgi:hypothetical protein